MADLSFDDLIPQQGGSPAPAPAASAPSFDDLVPSTPPEGVPAWLAPSYHPATPSQLAYGDFLRNTATGAVKGVGGLLDALAAAGSLDRFPGEPSLEDTKPQDMPSTLVTNPIFNHVMPEYKPSTLGGRLWQAGAGGATLGAVGGPWSSFLGLLSGIGGQGGGEAGYSLLGPWGGKIGSLLGSVAAPAAPGMLAARLGPLANAVREGTQTLSPQDWANAERLQSQSYGIGAPLLATESLDSPSLQRFTSDAMASRSGAPTINAFLGQRPDQVRNVVGRDILDPIAGPQNPSVLGPSAQQSASAALRVPEDARTAQSSPLFEAAKVASVPDTQLKPILDRLNLAIGKEGPTSRVRGELVKLRDTIGDESGNVTNTQIGPIFGQMTDFTNRVGYNPANPDAVAKSVSGAVTPFVQDLEGVLKRNNSDFAAGRWAHGAMTPPVDEAQALPLRDIAATDVVPTQYGAITNPKTAVPDNIRKTAGALNMQDHTSFPGLARSYFENAFDAATAPLQSGENPKLGFNFAKSVNGTDAQKANNQAILEGVAQAHGVPTGGLTAGFNTAMQVFDRMARIPGIGSPTAERLATNAELGSGPGVGLANVTIDKPSSWVGLSADKLRGWYMSRAYKQFAQAITSPDGVQQLRRLSMLNPQSRQAQLIVGTLAGLTSANAGEQNQGQ